MRHHARQQINSRRTAEGDGAVVSGKRRAFEDEVLFHHGHIVEGMHVCVLVVRQDEQYVGLSRPGCSLGAAQAEHQELHETPNRHDL